jgi:putative transposase
MPFIQKTRNSIARCTARPCDFGSSGPLSGEGIALQSIFRNGEPSRWASSSQALLSCRKAARSVCDIAAMDFFTVPTLTFGVLYCFWVIGHDRRKILRFNVTRNPHALWIVQQMGEAWPYLPAHRFLLFDHDSKFGTDVISAARDLGSRPTRTAFRSPWQNGVAERWVGSCRRDLLDHVIVLNELHLKRLTAEYVRYYHEDRTHLGLAKDTPTGRPRLTRSAVGGQIQSLPRLGGLHHRYTVAA